MAIKIEDLIVTIIPQLKAGAFNKLDKRVVKSSKGMGGLQKAIAGAFSLIAVRSFTMELLNTAQALAGIEARFFAITGSAKKAGEEFVWVKQMAKSLALPIQETADSYSLFMAATSAKMETSEIRGVAEEWYKAFRVLHLSAPVQQNIFYALREMVSKGKVYSQDLIRQIGTAFPDALGIAAKSMNMTEKEFRKAMEQGTLNATQFVKNFSVAVGKRFGTDSQVYKAMQGIDSQVANLKNSFLELKFAVLSSGMLSFFSKTIKALTTITEKINLLTPKLKDLVVIATHLAIQIGLAFAVVRIVAIVGGIATVNELGLALVTILKWGIIPAMKALWVTLVPFLGVIATFYGAIIALDAILTIVRLLIGEPIDKIDSFLANVVKSIRDIFQGVVRIFKMWRDTKKIKEGFWSQRAEQIRRENIPMIPSTSGLRDTISGTATDIRNSNSANLTQHNTVTVQVGDTVVSGSNSSPDEITKAIQETVMSEDVQNKMFQNFAGNMTALAS